MAGDDPRLTAARRIYERTGSRKDTYSALRNMRYGHDESQAAVDQVAPAQPKPKQPAPRGATAAPAPAGSTAKGSPTATSSTPPPSAAGGPLGTPSLSVPDMPRPTLSLPKRPDAGDVAGFGFGLVLYVLALNYLRYGPAGVKGWLSAKFLNQPASKSDLGTDALEQPTPPEVDPTPVPDWLNPHRYKATPAPAPSQTPDQNNDGGDGSNGTVPWM